MSFASDPSSLRLFEVAIVGEELGFLASGVGEAESKELRAELHSISQQIQHHIPLHQAYSLLLKQKFKLLSQGIGHSVHLSVTVTLELLVGRQFRQLEFMLSD